MSAALRTCVGSAHQNAATHAERPRSAPVAAVPQPTVRIAGRQLEWQEVSRRRRRRNVTVAAAVRPPPSLRLTLFCGHRRIFGKPRPNSRAVSALLRSECLSFILDCLPPLLTAVVAVLQGSRTTTQTPSRTESASYKANNDELKVSAHVASGTCSHLRCQGHSAAVVVCEVLLAGTLNPDHFACFRAFIIRISVITRSKPRARLHAVR